MSNFVYQVSGKYAMLRVATENRRLDERKAVPGIMSSFKRANCAGILTYYAEQIVVWLRGRLLACERAVDTKADKRIFIDE